MAIGNFQESLRNAARDAVCSALSGSQAFGNALVTAWQGVTGINASPPDFAGIAKGLLCGSPSPPFPPTNNGYGGANCVCDRYRVTYSLKRSGAGATLRGSDVLFGPIAAINLGPGGGAGNTRLEFLCRGKQGVDPACTPGFVTRTSGAGTSAGDIVSFEINAVQNLDSPGDNCTPVVVVPPSPLPDTGINFPDIPFSFSPGIEVGSPVINTDLDITIFQPFVDFDANIIVPLNLEVNLNVGSGNFNVNAQVNLNTGDINFNFGGGGSASGGGGSGYRPPSDCEGDDEPVKNPPPKPPSVPDKPDDPDVEERMVITGAIVTTTSVALNSRQTVIAQTQNPDIYAPAIGFISFFVEVGEAKVEAWTADIPVKNLRQYIPCPYDEGAKGVGGTPNPGYLWDITPIYEKIRTQLPKESNASA